MHNGSLGNIYFVTSTAYLLTFQDYSRGGAGRWAKHDLAGQKPVLEFIGPDIEEISLKIVLRSEWNVNVQNELRKLRKYRDNGLALPFMIGFRPVSQNLWTIESISEVVPYWNAVGGMISCEVTLTLKEHVLEVAKLVGS